MVLALDFADKGSNEARTGLRARVARVSWRGVGVAVANDGGPHGSVAWSVPTHGLVVPQGFSSLTWFWVKSPGRPPLGERPHLAAQVVNGTGFSDSGLLFGF